MRIGALLLILMPPAALAQPAIQPPASPVVVLPTLIVTAQKEPADAQRLPVSVTAVARDRIESAGISSVSDAAVFSPNTHFAELGARRISNAFIRGIGASPANPGITTYIDGVPQLNSSSSSVELLDVEQIEFVRGPQSALFGRNTLGGLVSLTSGRPSQSRWTGRLAAPFGSAGTREVRGTVGGPVADRLAVGLSLGRSDRDGFTTNDLTGHDLDYRSASFGKAQVLWVPAAHWEARAIVGGERARDGDYALNDLGELRRHPFHVARDFEGHTDRDIWSTTVLVRHEGHRLSLSSVTGFVSWKARDVTDLDYTPAPLLTRDDAEKDRQLTQEVRLASSASAPVRLSDRVSLRWQAGLFLFAQNYDQDAINSFSPFVVSPSLDFPVSQHSPKAALDDAGLSVYGQGTATLHEALDVTLGARLDRESKAARLETFYEPAVAPPTLVDAEKTYANVSPQVALAYRFAPGRTAYVSAGRGFKAGGFNPASPPGREAYGEEHAWNVEGGLKTAWANGRVSANAAVFHISWDDMQLNVPSPLVPAQFYIANVGGAQSRGVELEVNARPHAGVDLFGAVGFTRARFGTGSRSSGVDVSGNELPNTPEYTASLGVQGSRALGAATTLYGRADVVLYGAYRYDDANREGQGAYSLASIRAGVRGRRVFAEGWVKNAFDARYIPVAFPYGSLAPSGFVGESGRPRTLGLTAGFAF
jgi:iron complex outermembrane recepter protein